MFRYFLILLALVPWSAQAASISFTNMTREDFDRIVKEFSANSQFTTVSPASSLGQTWGLEFGVVGGLTDTPDIQEIVKRADPTVKDLDRFPHASAIAILSVPYGITAEAGFVPKITQDNVNYSQFGGALKWTMTDVVLTELPVTIAPRFFYTNTSLDFQQTISSIPVDVSFDNKLYGGSLMFSKKLLVFEPYIAGGYVKANADISAVGSATFFNTSFTSTQGASSTQDSFFYTAGLNIQLAFFVLGAEFNRAFEKNSGTAKLSFRF